MKINIYTSINGAGLQKDYELVRDILQPFHQVDLDNYIGPETATSGDIAFHMEIPRFEFLGLCKQNFFVPNCEWFYPKWRFKMRLFDGVIAKTRDAENIFKKGYFRDRPDRVYYLGFVAEDIYDKRIRKQRIFLHVAGQSETKGTQQIIQAYRKKPDLPKCFLIGNKGWKAEGNLILTQRLRSEDLQILYNSCIFHLCPSQYEGFGHYIHEGLSCKAVILTTDGAPMNEFITDQRFLIKVAATAQLRLAETKFVSTDSIIEKIEAVSAMSDQELKDVGDQNRETFQRNNTAFKENLFNFIAKYK